MHPLALAAFLASLAMATLHVASLLVGTLGVVAWVLAWPALSALVLAVAYAVNAPGLLGKRADGTHAPWAWALHAPYFLFTALTWRGQKLLGEPTFNQVAPGILVGRRVHAHELPADIQVVVDLTAEFTEPAGVRGRATYHCLPTLDAHAPDADGLRALVDVLANDTRTLFIHCASGHGRSASVAAAVMMRRGLASSAEEAQALMKRARPGVSLKPVQRARVNHVFAGKA